MKKSILALLLSATAFCNAGTYYLESITEIAYLDGSTGPLTLWPSRSISGHLISHSTSLDGFVSGSWSATSGTIWDVRVRVRWEEDYPGEPKPSGTAIVFDISSEGRAGYGPGPAWVDTFTSGATFTPAGSFSPSADYYAGATAPNLVGTGGTVSVPGAVFGGLTFGWDNGDWIGIGDITIGIDTTSFGNSTNSRLFGTQNSTQLLLIGTVGGDPIW